MTALRAPQIRGACPGALVPMESGDGLIVRVRPRIGALSVEALASIAEAASTCGNGAVDLTRRANLQVRGLTDATLAPMRDVLASLGVLDESAAAERLRNIMVGPLAGLDPNAPGFKHARALAADLESSLAAAPDLAPLTAKFGFAIDDGSALLSLKREATDIRLAFVSEDRVALGLDMKGGTRWLGEAAVQDGAMLPLEAARQFIRLTHGTKMKRLRDATPDVADNIEAALKLAPARELTTQAASQHFGIIRASGTPTAVSLGAPFGRIDAADLADFASTLRDLGTAEVRLAPWRAFVVPAETDEQADHILAAGLAHGFLVSDADPLAHIDVCPGAPACPCGDADTRRAARRLASLWPSLALTSAHVSGCTKGCARSEAADLVLVGRGDHFSIVRHGRADAPTVSTLPLTLEGLEALVAKQG